MDDRVSARAAERRLVTVLFADAKGSTALTERIGDEEMYRLMQGCVTAMQRAVEAHDGKVTQFRGDGIMALFGAPVAVEHAAVRAVTAALEMQEELRRHAQAVQERSGDACPFRIGLNTGPVVVGRVGDDTLVDYTAIGDTANVAARLEQAAGDGEVLVSHDTWRAVRDFVECEPGGSLELKGKQQEVVAYRAVRRREVRDRLDAVAARGLSRFVGRDDELALLLGVAQRLATDRDRRGRVVTISGEAGIGKSRLLRELRDRLPPGIDWFEGRSSSADRGTPWHLVIDLLRRALGVAEEHGHDDIAQLVAERAELWSEQARASSRYVRWVLGLPTPEVEGLDPQQLRAGVVEALVTVLRDAAERRPLVVSLEDVHWADEASEAVVAAITRAVADIPVLVIVTFRPERSIDFGDKPWFTRLALDGLGHDITGDLAAAALGAQLTAPAQQLIVERTEGNPLFVEELTASLIETGALVVRDGRIELAPDADRLRIPESLHDVVLTRIDRLADDARHALQLASVIGREFTRRILDRISHMPRHLDDHLAELESLELIHQRSWHPELSYLFKHAVVHDVTYSTLLDERRRALHRLVAEATEDLYSHALSDHCDALARHWLAAGDEERALPHLAEAARRAMAGFAVPRALEAFEQGATIAEAHGDLAMALELRAHRTEALLAISDVQGVLRESDRVAALARTVGATAAEASAMAMRSLAEFWAHDFDAALHDARAGRELATAAAEPDEGDADLADAVLLCSQIEAVTQAVLGELAASEESLAAGEPYLELARPAARGPWMQLAALRDNWRGRWTAEPPALEVAGQSMLAEHVLILWTTGMHRAGLGEYRTALEVLHEGLELCERTGELLCRARLLNTIGWVHGELGDVDGARHFNERSIVTIAPVGLPDREIEANARLNLADLALAHGELDETAVHLGALERTVRDPTPPEVWMLWRYGQRWRCASGELLLARGDDPERALGLAEECLAIAARTDSPKYAVRGGRLRGQALAAIGADEAAAASLEEALEGARALGNPPQIWRCMLALARHRRDGRLAAEAVELMAQMEEVLGDHPLAATLHRSPERTLAERLAG